MTIKYKLYATAIAPLPFTFTYYTVRGNKEVAQDVSLGKSKSSKIFV